MLSIKSLHKEIEVFMKIEFYWDAGEFLGLSVVRDLFNINFTIFLCNLQGIVFTNISIYIETKGHKTHLPSQH